VTTQPQDVGFDGNKRSKGRKRHTRVETLGLRLAVGVTAANVDDRQGFITLLETYLARGGPRLRKIGLDQGDGAQWRKAWAASLKQRHKIDVEVVERQGQGFQVEPQRWKVERRFSWMCNARRHCRDYEGLTCNSEAMIQISTIRMLLKRLIP
jgi:putative transposase